MVRINILWISALAWALGAGSPLSAQNPSDEENAFRNSLAVQSAMEHAIHFLHQAKPPQARKAVEVLEKHVERANGNARYLQLLRLAYRSTISELSLAGRADLAQIYQGRLTALEPGSVELPTAKTGAKAAPAEGKKGFFPSLGLTNPFRAPEPPQAKPGVVRAQSAEEVDDPFAVAHQRSPENKNTKSAQEFLTLAEREFARRKYTEARSYYEQAYQVDQTSLQTSKDRYAYCLLSHLTEQVNGGGNKNWPELKRQVESVIRYAPSMSGEGGKLLQAIDGRMRGASPPQVQAVVTPALNVAIRHLGKNPEGWQVAETSHFRFFHQRETEYVEQIARKTEETRVVMAKKWFGSDTQSWEPKCEVILHPNASMYTQMTGVPSSSPGHSRIERDRSDPARVVSRRMDLRLDLFGILEGVLPHETTHVVIAGQFGPFDVPRWVDEGIAVLSETEAKVDQHRKNVMKAHQEGTLFRLRDLMQLQDYPQPRQIGAFYAQSVVLVEWLTQMKGPIAFTQFVRDGLREGYDSALRRHYDMDLNELERRWNQQVMPPILRVSASQN